MWKYFIPIALMIIEARQISSNSIGSNSLNTELPLYDDYSDEYYDQSMNKTREFSSKKYQETKIEQNETNDNISSNKKPTSIRISSSAAPTMSSQTDDNSEEDPIILSAGLSQVYSRHNANPKRDEKSMKLLLEKTGDEAQVPMNCSQYKMLTSQPALLPVVTIPKCCHPGESYYFNETTIGCASEGTPFEFDLIHAVFYEGCIEDQELDISYRIEQKSPCAGGILYNENYGDFLYVLSNGSLLRVAEDWEYYDIFDEYCLDMTYDNNNFVLSAISCHDVYGGVVHVSQVQGLICAVLMMISVPCLIIVALIYIFIPNLNDMHGKALALHSLCLAIGYLLLALIQFTEFREGPTGYVIQYFILAAFFWMLLMVMDIAVEVWHYLPNGIEISTYKENCRLFSYTIIAQGMPLIFVFLTYYEGYPGLPSYYFRANEAGEMASQKYFIPVVTVILIFSLVISIITEYGYSKLNNLQTLSFMQKFSQRFSRQTSRVSRNTLQRQISEKIKNLDQEKIEKVATMKRSTNILLAVMCINWIFEIISFYFTSSRISPILFLDVLNSLQGAFIFMLFVCLPGPLNIIRKYFKDKYHMKDETRERELTTIREALLVNGTTALMTRQTSTNRRGSY